MSNCDVLWNLTYGLYALTTLDGDRPTGCIINTAIQVTSQQPLVAFSLSKGNFTHGAILKNKHFAISILSQNINRNVIAKLGFTSGKNSDKFAGNLFTWEYWSGLPIISENICGAFSAELVSCIDAETHSIFIGRVQDTKSVENNLIPMTYKYYHDVFKGKAPKNAPTYRGDI